MMNESIAEIGPTDAPAALEPQPSPGAVLSRRRAERGLTLKDVAQRLKYGTRQIEALERDDYPKLPGHTFVRGMTRSYAKLLEIDPVPLLRELERREIPSQVTVDLRAKRIPFPDGSKRATRVYAVLSALVVLVAAAVIFEWQVGYAPWNASALFPGVQNPPAVVATESRAPANTIVEIPRTDTTSSEQQSGQAEVVPAQDGGSPAVKQAQASILPATAPPAPALPVATSVPAVVRVPMPQATVGKARILLQFQRESWVEIKQADGRVIMSQMNHGGSEQELGGTPPFDVVIGNAPSVRLVYNGQTVDLRPHFKVDVARLILE